MTPEIRRAGTDDGDLRRIVEVMAAVTPEHPTSIDELRWVDASYPGVVRFLAEAGGRAVGVATVGRLFMYPPDFDAYWATLGVLAGQRRRGIGGALYLAVSEVARDAGKVALHVPTSEARPEGLTFLRDRGFEEYDRVKLVRLDLAGATPPALDPPPGIAIVSLAERPDLVPGIHAVAVEAYADVPNDPEPFTAGSLEEFRARDIDRPSIARDGFAIAIDEASGDVVGWASLKFVPGASDRASHDMTAVARAWRRRGVASALKRWTIAWAVGRGLASLDTESVEANAPMRALNERLGYRPLPDALVMRGPLSGGMMER